jgi:hypothetical protein
LRALVGGKDVQILVLCHEVAGFRRTRPYWVITRPDHLVRSVQTELFRSCVIL